MFVSSIALDASRALCTCPTPGTPGERGLILRLPKPSMLQFVAVNFPTIPYHDVIVHCHRAARYHIPHEAGKPHSSYDVLTKKKAGNVLNLAKVTPRPGGHRLVSCSTVQFSDWKSSLQKWTETIRSSSDDAEHAEKERNCFEFEQNDLFYLQNSGRYLRHPSKRSVDHINMAEHAILFWRSGSSSEYFIRSVNKTTFPPFSGHYSSNVNTVFEISRVKVNKMVLILDKLVGSSGRQPMLRPKQKSVDAIRHVIRNFPPSKSSVRDPCFGTGTTARAGLLDPQQENFYGREADGHCVNVIMTPLL